MSLAQNSLGKKSVLHLEKYISIHIELYMIVLTVFLLILIQMEIYLVQNRKENCHHDHISFDVKGNGNIEFLSVPYYDRLRYFYTIMFTHSK